MTSVRTKGTAARVAAVFLWAMTVAAFAADDAAPAFARAFVIEIDGVRRSARAADTPLPPASLTKMMSGLLVAESGRELGEPVTVSAAAASATGSRLGLRAGDRMRAADLLTAMMVASSNDACRALAEWHAGSEAQFVDAMNVRAERLGLSRTRFANACGHDALGHVATANDLATLARAAMAAPELARRAGLANAELRTVDGRRRFRISNHNQLIGRSQGVIGVKSGFTARAGKCIVALARRGPHEVLLVMLDAKNRWWDAHDALDYAFRRAPELAPR
jgi:serine-type D-Ala-D-Ala carboxypeptidase (penicillin-binding protein 5/6)